MATVEYMRFTREDHVNGLTNGWRFAAGWFLRFGGSAWAWFVRETTDG